MTEVDFYDILRQGLWVSVAMSAPLLGIALIAVGAGGILYLRAERAHHQESKAEESSKSLEHRVGLG